MRRPILIAAAVGALAVGGTAIADPGGGPVGALLGDGPKAHKAELARDLASKLDGVSAGQVERALDQVHRERRAEHRTELARGLASKLDGVSVEEAQNALEKSEAQMRRGFERGRPPRTRPAEILARELGKSEEEVHRAMRTLHRERFDRKLDEAVKEGRISEGQADRIRERIRQGPPAFRRRFGPGRPGDVAPAPRPPGGPGAGPGGPGGPGHGPPGDFAIPVPPPPGG